MSVIIGLGNAGTQIVRLASQSKLLEHEEFYSIDSVVSSVNMGNVGMVKSIPIISDEKSGSGRNRDRGRAMFEFHKKQDKFASMLEACKNSKDFVIAISSSSGGTGSGAIVGLCDYLIKNNVPVIPIIIFPAQSDPSAYHLNTNDLIYELGEITTAGGEPGIVPYSIFVNPPSTDYTNINRAVVRSIETILGYHYDPTDMDSIDDSDLATLFQVPGRFISVYCEAHDAETLRREITKAILSGYQPGWSLESVEANTFFAALSISSAFPSSDFNEVFADIIPRLGKNYDTYKNIAVVDNNICYATAIIAGLPTVKTKDVADDFSTVGGISEGLKKSQRPSFMSKKKAVIEKDTSSGNDVFNWV